MSTGEPDKSEVGYEAVWKRNEGYRGIRELLAGGAAGLCVDLTLFPLDTIKTRLQSELGFWQSGGFSRIYAGLPSVAIGSVPGAALFFGSYEGVKQLLLPYSPAPTFAHMAGAVVGETVACIVRVPTEVLKQRAQAYPKRTLRFIFRRTYSSVGFRGFYRGYWSTVMREIPFSFIQFPLWEQLKKLYAQKVLKGERISPFESAACGSFAGTVAAGITTPLDVAKTRIMLSQKLYGPEIDGKILPVLKDIWEVQGIRGVFSGFLPRIFWMGIGGFIFFGAYETACKVYTSRAAPKGSGEPIHGVHEQGFPQFEEALIGRKFAERKVVTFEEKMEAAAKEKQAWDKAHKDMRKYLRDYSKDPDARPPI